MEDACDVVLNTGLRGVTIADTRICDVDGANGKLIYRGYLIQDLAAATFEEVVYLLLCGGTKRGQQRDIARAQTMVRQLEE